MEKQDGPDQRHPAGQQGNRRRVQGQICGHRRGQKVQGSHGRGIEQMGQGQREQHRRLADGADGILISGDDLAAEPSLDPFDVAMPSDVPPEEIQSDEDGDGDAFHNYCGMRKSSLVLHELLDGGTTKGHGRRPQDFGKVGEYDCHRSKGEDGEVVARPEEGAGIGQVLREGSAVDFPRWDLKGGRHGRYRADGLVDEGRIGRFHLCCGI